MSTGVDKWCKAVQQRRAAAYIDAMPAVHLSGLSFPAMASLTVW